MAALQLAERGFFVKELNVGWKQWTAQDLPVHAGRPPRGEFRCECSFEVPQVVAKSQGI